LLFAFNRHDRGGNKPGSINSRALGGGAACRCADLGEPPMPKNNKFAATPATETPTKHQKVIDLLNCDRGATLEELSTLANWLPHSTRAYLTGLKKKGHVVDSDKVDGYRCYRIISSMTA
jgi:hypothetical protein